MQSASLQPAFGLLTRGNVADAVSEATALLESSNLALVEVMTFGEKLRSGEHFKDSLPFFDYVLSHSPDPLEARISKAKSLCDLNDKPQAMVEVDTIKLLAEGSIERQIRLFDLLSYMKSYTYAEEMITLLIKQNPSHFSLRRQHIMMCLNRGKADWAIKALDEAAGAIDLTGPEWTFTARSYLQARNPERAAWAASQAVEKTAPPALAERLLLAQACVGQDNRKAKRELDAVAPQFDGGSQALLQVAEIYLAVGEKPACKAAIGRILAFHGDRVIPMLTKVSIARMLGASDDHERCHALFSSFPIETLKDKHVLRHLHNSAYDVGYYEIAGRAARQGLTLTPYDPDYMAHNGQITTLGLKDPPIVEKRQSSSPSSSRGLLRLFRRA